MILLETPLEPSKKRQSKKRRKSEPELICVSNFKYPVSSCSNKFILDYSDHLFVDLDRAATDCISIIKDQIPSKTTHTERVPPLVLMRLARGGKTLTLARVFDLLKDDASKNPILISFNGNGPNAYKRRIGESQAESILRLIALQLDDYTVEEAQNIVVDRAALDPI